MCRGRSGIGNGRGVEVNSAYMLSEVETQIELRVGS